MKRLKSLTILPILLLASLTSCGGNNGLSWKSGDKVYYDRIIFDTSDVEADNPHIYLGLDAKVNSVKLGREEIKFGYSGKVLTLSAEALKKVGPGEKSATVSYTDSKTKKQAKLTVDIFSATKFIKTAEDFQGIGADKKACEGYYILANDIDCSSIANFEPIGQYFSEQDPTNFYFHGILDGDGFAIKNVNCSYSDNPTGPNGFDTNRYPSNFDVYSGNPKFDKEAHQQGDNIGIFQVIGSSGVVKNISFDNCKVHGRTIVGVVAGNIMGRAENILINSNCSVKMDTHFYDDDCNVGAAFGIVAGNAQVKNIISLTSQVSILEFYEDYGPDYAGKDGNGWDHPAGSDNGVNWWRFAGVSKPMPGNDSQKIMDNNGRESNGVYSVVGKCWGQVQDSIGVAFKVAVGGEKPTQFDVSFGHTHTAVNKPTSGDSDLGSIENCSVFTTNNLKKVETYEGFNFSKDVWNFFAGTFPTLKHNINRFSIAK